MTFQPDINSGNRGGVSLKENLKRDVTVNDLDVYLHLITERKYTVIKTTP